MTGSFKPAGRQELVAIFACDEGGGIGLDGSMPWHFPSDLARFKRLTLGRPVIMGRLTFLSLPRALPGRKNIVLTSTTTPLPEGVEAASNVEDAIGLAAGWDRATIIGGASVFSAFGDRIDRYEITLIPGDYGCDVFVDRARLTDGYEMVAEEPGEDGLVFTTWVKPV